MRRAVEKHLEDPLAEHLLRGDIKQGDTVSVALEEGDKILTFTPNKGESGQTEAEEAASKAD